MAKTIFMKCTLVDPANQENYMYNIKKSFVFDGEEKKLVELMPKELKLIEKNTLEIKGKIISETDSVVLKESDYDKTKIDVKCKDIIIGRILDVNTTYLMPFIKAKKFENIFEARIIKLDDKACDASGITIEIDIKD